MPKPQISEQQITDSIVAALQQKINQLPKQPEAADVYIKPIITLGPALPTKVIPPTPVTLPPATSPEDAILPLLPPMAETSPSSLLPLLAVGAILLMQ